MKLFLVRHSAAEDVARSDDARELTEEGEVESRIAGRALAKLKVKPDRVLTSPLVRARQTASIAAKALKFRGKIEVVDELRNNVATAEVLTALKPWDPGAAVVLVGHMPSLSEHLAALIAARDPDALPFDKGGIACVELSRLQLGKGRLRWFARQKQLRRIAR